MLSRQLIELALQLFNLQPQGVHSLVTVFLNFIDTDDLPFERLCFLEEHFVHLLHLVALHSVLLLQGHVLLEGQLQMRLFTL